MCDRRVARLFVSRLNLSLTAHREQPVHIFSKVDDARQRECLECAVDRERKVDSFQALIINFGHILLTNVSSTVVDQ